MNLEQLRKIGKRSAKTVWYKSFSTIYTKESPEAAAAWLKGQAVFDKLIEHLDYYPGKSGAAIKRIETFALMFPSVIGVCQVCGSPTRWFPAVHNWRETCSLKCGHAHSNEARQATSMDRYGVANPSSAPEIQKRRVKTFKKKYGVDNPWKSEAVKRKSARTTMELYGVSNISQSEIGKARKRATSLERFGEEHWAKVFQTSFDTENPMHSKKIRARIEQTNLKRYGNKVATKNLKVADKCRDSMLRLLSNPVRRKEFVEKIRKSKFDRHGDGYYTGEYKRYAVTDRSGVEHSVQGYERYVIPELDALGVISIRTKGLPNIRYGDHVYRPDILTKTKGGTLRLIEVKSIYTLKIDLHRNLKKFEAAEKRCRLKGVEFWLAIVADTKNHTVRWVRNPAEEVRLLLGQQ